MNRFTKEEEEYLLHNYSNMTNNEIAKVLGKTERALRNKGSLMHLKKSAKILKRLARESWSDDRKRYTSENYKKRLRSHIDIPKGISIYNSGVGLHDTAKQVGTSQQTMRNILVDNGIEIRKVDYNGKNNPMYKKPLTKEQIAKAQKTKMERYGKVAFSTEYSRKRQSENMIEVNRKLGMHMGSTSLEKAVKDFLENIGMKENIDFVYNKILFTNPGFVFPDFRIESKKLCIEADGEHWHDDKIREEMRDNRIRKLGYVVVHLPGKEIQSGDFKYKLLKVLN